MGQPEEPLTATSAASQPPGVDGRPLHVRQEQIRAVVERRLGIGHALLLAEARRRKGTNITDWYTPAPGPRANAAALDERQRDVLRAKVDRMLADIDRIGKGLESAPGSGARAAGRHLRLAARRPDDDSLLYRVDNQPVLVAWGHDGERPVAPAISLAEATRLAEEQAAAARLAQENEARRRLVRQRLLAGGLGSVALVVLGVIWALAG